MEERRELWMREGGGGEGNRLIFNNRESDFPFLFMLLPLSLFIDIVRVFVSLWLILSWKV